MRVIDFAETEAQKKYYQGHIEGKSFRAMGREYGVDAKVPSRSVKRTKLRAAKHGVTESVDHSKHVYPGQVVKGVSSLIDSSTGESKIQWIKTDADKEALNRQLEEFVEAMGERISEYKPLPRVKAPKGGFNDDLLVLIPMGDPHIGMYSWAAETGADFDCDIAEAHLRGAVQHLIDKSPRASTAILLNLGDFFHSDNQSNQTARAGNALDVDSRWARVLQIGISLMIDCVNMALEKYDKVIVKNNIGNHDDHTSQVLSVCMMWAFKNNPRVTIEEPQKAFFCYEFGKNLVLSTHGHMVKPAKMQGVVANYFPAEWGRTEHRLCLVGHFHHESRQEENGLVTEIFNTLAASDAWHHASGYKSKRNMKLIVLDKEHGEVERYTFNIGRGL